MEGSKTKHYIRSRPYINTICGILQVKLKNKFYIGFVEGFSLTMIMMSAEREHPSKCSLIAHTYKLSILSPCL